ncbi:unnamed protein product, partial [marine sediment metagenome]
MTNPPQGLIKNIGEQKGYQYIIKEVKKVVSKMGKALSLWLVLAIIATCVGCGDEGPTDETVTDET